MESFRISRNTTFLKTKKDFLLERSNERSYLCTSRNSTQRDFNRILKSKHKMLKDQIVRVKKANINLESFERLRKLKMLQIKLSKKQNQLQTESAVKIQKVFRGYITRKKTSSKSYEVQKNKAFLKIYEMNDSVYSIFLHRKYTEDAALKIQRAFRSYKKRKIIELYINLWRHWQRIMENKRIVRHGFKIFACRMKLSNLRWERELEMKIKKLREDHAMRVIAKYWKQNKLNKKKFVKRARRYRGGYYRHDRIRTSTVKDGALSAKNSEKEQNTSENSISRKHSIRKKPPLLPNLPMSPAKLKKKAMLFIIKPKKILEHRFEKSRSSAVRFSVQAKEISVTFPKLTN